MVSPLSLYAFAAVLVALAGLVARLAGTGRSEALADGRAALAGALAALTASAAFFALAGPPAAGAGLRFEPGSLALLASPLAATLALRRRGRRSTPRALVASSVALAGLVLWLTLNLRGPHGGWRAIELALVVGAAALAISAAACLGWWSKGPAPPGAALAGLALLVVAAASGCGEAPERGGVLELTLRDAATGEPTPARLELLDPDGRAVVPEEALEVFADCGSLPLDAWLPGSAALQALANGHRAIPNPYTGTTQFYSGGSLRVSLPAGSYAVRATRGSEYRRARRSIAVEAGRVTRLDLGLERWIDLAGEGWYGADDHLHIPRPHPRLDPRLATWMQAEGLHVANLLQMGLARDVQLTVQHGFGPHAVYRQGDTLLLSGQENPRSHVLGHAVLLGARRFIDLPAEYLLYDRVWEEARREGAANGYAHWALAGAEEGLALWGHRGLLDFIEVLNLGFPYYDRWYEALDLGMRIGPTAGTDYPCLPGLPGRDRFYTRLDGPLEPAAWLEAVRRGRTFVTNGPAIELEVAGAGPGEELRLERPGAVEVRGRVRFDRERDAVAALELIRGGVVAARVEAPADAAEIRLETVLEIERTSWLALRARGVKVGETEIHPRRDFAAMLVLPRGSNDDLLRALPEGPVPRPSAAHTGAVLVTVEGTPPLAAQPRGREVARVWHGRLDELERRLDPQRIASWARFPGRGDGIDPETARANRAALLEAIATARRQVPGRRP